MFRKTMSVALLGMMGLWSGLAQAGGFLTVGPHQFKPKETTAGVTYGVYAQGARSNTAGYMTAVLNLPVGSRITAMWCQVYDTSAKNINVNISEVYTDANGSGAERSILALNSSGVPGHAQYATSNVLGSNVIRTFDSSAPNGANRFYSYTLEAFLDGTASTGIKGCLIQYD
jgi:hypothetical protein